MAEETCLERLSGLGDKLETITKAPVNRDAIRDRIDGLLPDRTKGGRGGRPPVDKLLLFKMTLLKRWYGLSSGGVECQVAPTPARPSLTARMSARSLRLKSAKCIRA